MNDTPITDANRLPDFDRGGDVVLADVAAELERELTAARAEIENLKFICKCEGESSIEAHDILKAVTEQRDRLAEALQSLRSCIQDTRGKDAYEAVKNADEALQSLTTNEL